MPVGIKHIDSAKPMPSKPVILFGCGIGQGRTWNSAVLSGTGEITPSAAAIDLIRRGPPGAIIQKEIDPAAIFHSVKRFYPIGNFPIAAIIRISGTNVIVPDEPHRIGGANKYAFRRCIASIRPFLMVFAKIAIQ